jgi:CubicO group peptidase (beta-lactamase class C family)
MRIRMTQVVAAALALTAPGIGRPATLAAQQGRASAVPGWVEFTRAFDAYADSGKVVGGSAVLVRDGRIVARHDYGLADRSRAQPVNDRTIFHYGSITKTLTAIAIMQLRDRGRLTLDDRVTRYIPELRRVHDPFGAMDSITIRMLLSPRQASRTRPGRTSRGRTGSRSSPRPGSSSWR